MPLCIAIGCCNKSYRKSKEQINIEKNIAITFHRFPQDESKKLTWAKVMGLQMECLPKSSHLCSLHFSDDDFDRSSLIRIRLRENAIPISNISKVAGAEEVSLQSNTLSATSTESVHEDDSICEPEISRITLKRKREEESTSFGVYTEQPEDTPRKKLLRKTLMHQKKYYERQVQTLKQKNKRYEKRIAQLNTVLKELKQKSLLADEHADILKTIDLVSPSNYK
ncbi:THAP domain-containing protein 6-like isoform X2 [Solenopsis invicta]|uniref:THAP domain-containing protein 6-like isoform X2 n=1 Tax=Solenopsis invicta TaxID=13686 RepID=UPI00193DAF08|nr:THAP domain-containing protein 6-like isoform X2 [Solenopsis invicta]